MSTGPIPPNVLRELEQLKLRLAGLGADEIAAADAESIRVEISAIRLQLQRLAAERRPPDLRPRA